MCILTPVSRALCEAGAVLCRQRTPTDLGGSGMTPGYILCPWRPGPWPLLPPPQPSFQNSLWGALGSLLIPQVSQCAAQHVQQRANEVRVSLVTRNRRSTVPSSPSVRSLTCLYPLSGVSLLSLQRDISNLLFTMSYCAETTSLYDLDNKGARSAACSLTQPGHRKRRFSTLRTLWL